MFENTFKRIIKLIDLFGREPKFTIEKSHQYKTFTGGLLSLIIILLIIAAFIYFGRKLFDKDNPTILSSTIFQVNPDEYVLTQENFGFFVGIQNTKPEYYIDPTVINVIMRFVTIKRENKDGQVTFNRTDKFLKSEPCQEERHFPSFKKEFSKSPFSSLYCVNPDEFKNVSLAGNFGEDIFQLFSIIVSPCRNSTDSSITCKSEEQINKYLSGGFFSVNHIDTIFEPKNFKEPRKFFKRDFYTSLSNRFYKEVTFYFKNIEYKTDRGYLTEDIKTNHYLQLDNIRELYDFRSETEGIILKCHFRLSNQKQIFNRTYIKIQDILAQVGGLLEALIVGVHILYSNFSSVSYNFFLGETLFESHDSDKKENTKVGQKKLDINENILNKSDRNPIKEREESSKINIALPKKEIDKKQTSFYECLRLGICLCFTRKNIKNKNTLFIKLSDYIDKKSDFRRFLINQEKLELLKEIMLDSDQKIIFDYYTQKIDLTKYTGQYHKLDNQLVIQSYEAINSKNQNEFGERLKEMFDKTYLNKVN